MTVVIGWLLNASEATPGQTRANTRQAPTSSVTPADALSSVSGIVPGGTPMLLTGSGMTGSVSTGRAYIQGTSAQGVYPAAVTAAEPITVANGHASLSRIDSVFLVVFDKQFDTSAATVGQVVYVQGTASASPVAPSAPATSLAALRLWDILVPAGASAGSPINWGTALTDRRVYSVAVGGIGIGTNGNGAVAGQYRDTGGLQRWSGSTWEDRLYLNSTGRYVVGADTEWYRGAANQWRTPDNVVIDGSLTVSGALTVSGVGQFLFARKAADQSIVSNTTLTLDNNLVATVVANGVYVLSGLIAWTAGTVGDFRYGWQVPSGSVDWVPTMQGTGATSSVGTVITDRSNAATTQAGGGIGSLITTSLVTGLLVVGATGGTFGVKWAQDFSDATATVLKANSYILLQRVA